MDFKKVLGKKIITDDQIEEINNKLSLKEFEIDKLKLIIQHQHELLEQKERELITLKEMIQILREKN